MKNTLKKQRRNGGTRKIRGGAVRAIRPDFNNYGDIAELGFDIPKKGNAGKTHSFDTDRTDFYKFLEMAKKNMITDMRAMLHKEGDYQVNSLGGGIHARTEKMCKFMYLIRAVDSSGYSVLHHICNNGSLQMFDLVFPYYLTLYNHEFPELLGYYFNLKSTKDGKTPLDALVNFEDINWKGKGSTLRSIKNVVVNPLSTAKSAADAVGSKAYRLAAAGLGGGLNWERLRIYCLMRQFGAYTTKASSEEETKKYENEFGNRKKDRKNWTLSKDKKYKSKRANVAKYEKAFNDKNKNYKLETANELADKNGGESKIYKGESPPE